jgi:hypothetical protein
VKREKLRVVFLAIVACLVQLQLSAQIKDPTDLRDLYDGVHTIIWENGTQYIGEIYSGEFSGKGTMIWSDSSYYEGNWSKGMRNGKGDMVWANGIKFFGQRTERMARWTYLSWPFCGRQNARKRQNERGGWHHLAR